ncbi:hypothetical protein BJX61DRAFT_545645 [Aspergillus egyptiacus]|nr:hypothetical protein BJX61DRAFT_545645 [Aspergillus egyptiacus]
MPGRDGLRKRKQPTSTEDRTKSSAKRGPRTSSEHKRDPLKYLNSDTLNIVFNLIPSEDLVRLERVSRDWKTAIRAWIETFGLRTRFPFSWMLDAKPTTSHVVYDIFKKHARREFLVQSGRPTRVTNLGMVDRIAFAGDYIVWSTTQWSTLFEIDGGSDKPADHIHWQCFAPARQRSDLQPATSISSARFLMPSDNPRVVDLSVNEDGVISCILKHGGSLSLIGNSYLILP